MRTSCSRVQFIDQKLAETSGIQVYNFVKETRSPFCSFELHSFECTWREIDSFINTS